MDSPKREDTVQTLRNKLEDFDTTEQGRKKRTFNADDFKSNAKEVRKTFGDEDISKTRKYC